VAFLEGVWCLLLDHLLLCAVANVSTPVDDAVLLVCGACCFAAVDGACSNVYQVLYYMTALLC
jgi:hypothetical protein